MLGGLALKRRWQKRRKAEGKSTEKPNLVTGINVQVCWDKFANYWDVEMRLVPMEGDRYHLSPEEAVKLCDENTIGVVVVMGSTFDGSYEDVKKTSELLDDLQKRTGLDIPIHVDGASGGFIAPFLDPDLEWDFRVPRVQVDQRLRAQVRPRVPRRRLGRCGATPRRCPRTSSSGSTTSATTCRPSRSTSRGPARRSWPSTTTSCASGFEGYKRVQELRPQGGHVHVGGHRRDGAVRAAHQGRRAAGVRLHAQGRGRRTTPCSTCPRRCASAAGRCRPTPSRRTARTWRPCASSCAAASRWTWPTCCLTTCARRSRSWRSCRAGLQQDPGGFHH